MTRIHLFRLFAIDNIQVSQTCFEKYDARPCCNCYTDWSVVRNENSGHGPQEEGTQCDHGWSINAVGKVTIIYPILKRSQSTLGCNHKPEEEFLLCVFDGSQVWSGAQIQRTSNQGTAHQKVGEITIRWKPKRQLTLKMTKTLGYVIIILSHEIRAEHVDGQKAVTGSGCDCYRAGHFTVFTDADSNRVHKRARMLFVRIWFAGWRHIITWCFEQFYGK